MKNDKQAAEALGQLEGAPTSAPSSTDRPIEDDDDDFGLNSVQDLVCAKCGNPTVVAKPTAPQEGVLEDWLDKWILGYSGDNFKGLRDDLYKTFNKALLAHLETLKGQAETIGIIEMGVPLSAIDQLISTLKEK